MRAVARVVAEPDGRGGTRLARLRSQAPLILRGTPESVYLVGGAGGPLGGDDLTIEIDVRPGAELTVRAPDILHHWLANLAVVPPGITPACTWPARPELSSPSPPDAELALCAVVAAPSPSS